MQRSSELEVDNVEQSAKTAVAFPPKYTKWRIVSWTLTYPSPGPTSSYQYFANFISTLILFLLLLISLKWIPNLFYPNFLTDLHLDAKFTFFLT